MTRGYDADRIRSRLVPIELDRVFRVIRRMHVETPLGAVPAPSRFSDPNGRYSILYASEAVRSSFWETLVRNRFDRRKRRELPRSEVEDRLVVEIRSTVPLSLVDLRGDGPIRIAAPTAVAHDADHAAARSLSAETYHQVPEADGFLFQSRFTGHRCVAVFDRAASKLETLSITPLTAYADFHQALEDYAVRLVRPAG